MSTGDSWDDALPKLDSVRRIALRKGGDRFDDIRAVNDKAYRFTFGRSFGQYRLREIARSPGEDQAAAIAVLPDWEKELKVRMTMGEALPILQRDAAGRFLFDTRDLFHARVTGASGAVFLIFFQRPKGIAVPDVVATATQKELRMSGSMPLDTLPEFVSYRLARIQKER